MRSKRVLLAGLLFILGIVCQPQAQADPGPVGPTPSAFTISDLKAEVSAFFDPDSVGQVLVSGLVTNLGPGKYSGQRTIKLTATTNGKTTPIKGLVKISKLKVNKGFFTIQGVVPAANVNQNTVYKATISASPGDSKPGNDTAVQVGL